MTILIIVVIIIAIPFIAALFLSPEYLIEREIIINTPKQEVFDFIKLLRNHAKFNKWTMTDPNVRLDYRGTDGTVGFVSAWDSDNKNVGKGEQEIIKLEDGKRIDYALRFIKPFESTAGAHMITEAAGADKTKVTWAFTGTRSYTNRIMHFLLNLKKMLGNDLQTGLNNLKNVMEK